MAKITTKEEAYEWVENTFFGDLDEKEMVENLKYMVDFIFEGLEESKRIVFDKTFVEKIKKGSKVITVRNKPYPLGRHIIDEELTIEIYECKKVAVSFHSYMGSDDIEFFNPLGYPSMASSIESKFGFDSKAVMVEFYKQYLKHNYAYQMRFEVVS